jgi:hypothetical protein
VGRPRVVVCEPRCSPGSALPVRAVSADDETACTLSDCDADRACDVLWPRGGTILSDFHAVPRQRLHRHDQIHDQGPGVALRRRGFRHDWPEILLRSGRLLSLRRQRRNPAIGRIDNFRRARPGMLRGKERRGDVWNTDPRSREEPGEARQQGRRTKPGLAGGLRRQCRATSQGPNGRRRWLGHPASLAQDARQCACGRAAHSETFDCCLGDVQALLPRSFEFGWRQRIQHEIDILSQPGEAVDAVSEDGTPPELGKFVSMLGVQHVDATSPAPAYRSIVSSGNLTTATRIARPTPVGR